jgi:hypothetical protein
MLESTLFLLVTLTSGSFNMTLPSEPFCLIASGHLRVLGVAYSCEDIRVLTPISKSS